MRITLERRFYIPFQSTAMKMMGQHKEANRFLRSIDFDEAADTLTRDEVP